MKTSDLEQRLKECNYRLSKMDERIKRLEEENEQLKRGENLEIGTTGVSSQEVARLDGRIKALSDELYEYIGSQIRQQVAYTDENKEHLEKRIKGLSDELYEYIEEQLRKQKELMRNS